MIQPSLTTEELKELRNGLKDSAEVYLFPVLPIQAAEYIAWLERQAEAESGVFDTGRNK